MMFEQKIHSAFDGHITDGFFGNFNKFEGSFICPYHISTNEFHTDWAINHIKNHHDVIFSDHRTGRAARVSNSLRKDRTKQKTDQDENRYLVNYKIKKHSKNNIGGLISSVMKNKKSYPKNSVIGLINKEVYTEEGNYIEFGFGDFVRGSTEPIEG